MSFRLVFRWGLYVACFLFLMVLVSMVSNAEPSSAMVTVSYEDIPVRAQILGKLRCPLMEVVTVRGKWGHTSRHTPKETVFTVTQVNGKTLEPPAEFLEINPVDKVNTDFAQMVAGEEWELRGVESGGFVGFPAKTRRELGLPDLQITGPKGMGGDAVDQPPHPAGFLTTFCYVSAKRIPTAMDF